MPFQVPKKDHPWRRYKDRKTPSFETEKGKVKPIRVFLREIVEAWDRVEVYTSAFGRDDRFKLTELPQQKIAAWLSGILRRNYGQS